MEDAACVSLDLKQIPKRCLLFRLSDLAQHYLVKANITAIRRVRKTDNNRIAR